MLFYALDTGNNGLIKSILNFVNNRYSNKLKQLLIDHILIERIDNIDILKYCITTKSDKLGHYGKESIAIHLISNYSDLNLYNTVSEIINFDENLYTIIYHLLLKIKKDQTNLIYINEFVRLINIHNRSLNFRHIIYIIYENRVGFLIKSILKFLTPENSIDVLCNVIKFDDLDAFKYIVNFLGFRLDYDNLVFLKESVSHGSINIFYFLLENSDVVNIKHSRYFHRLLMSCLKGDIGSLGSIIFKRILPIDFIQPSYNNNILLHTAHINDDNDLLLSLLGDKRLEIDNISYIKDIIYKLKDMGKLDVLYNMENNNRVISRLDDNIKFKIIPVYEHKKIIRTH